MDKKPYSLNSFQLKCIAAALMVLDHLRQFLPQLTPLWFRYLGRVVAPVFFFLSVEGFLHTRSRPKYMARLFGAGLAMAIGSGVLNYWFPTPTVLHNNIFFSLGLGVALMSALEKLETTQTKGDYWRQVTAVILISAASLFTEASLYGIFMTKIFYSFRQDKRLFAIYYTIGSLLPIVTGPLTFDRLFFFDYQWMMIFALPLIFLYNGEPGPRTIGSKWFFYIFYPAHLWSIYMINYMLLAK